MSNGISVSLPSIIAIMVPILQAQDSSANRDQCWNFHFQQTIIVQYHPDFSAQYSGQHSLLTSEPPQTSITSTFFVGTRLWKNTEIYFNPELGGGSGLSGATGVAGFPNGETYRIGDPSPQITLARLFIKQSFLLSDVDTSFSDEPNQLAGRRSLKQLKLSLGKISITDFFDNNSYSHDPRTQFMNWALMSNGAWDYPANTHGYTWGVVAELILRPWALRISSAMVPTEANKSEMDRNISRAHSETIEFERSYIYGSQKGVVRLMGYITQARMGNYRKALQLPPGQIDIVTTRDYGRTKYGFGLNIEHTINENIGLMLRAGWNDGTNETWMFTEIDQTISAALLLDGVLWQRNSDNAGFAIVLNGISQDHRTYLEAGGLGFMIGDGNLSYAPEFITEVFYTLTLSDFHLAISPDYQFIYHPAYNAARGPVHVLGIRAHLSF